MTPLDDHHGGDHAPAKHVRNIGIVVLGAAGMAAGAQLSIPMVPVPTTLQTLAVVLLGLLAGPWLAMGSATLYLVLVLAGLPVLSSGQQHGGWAFLDFPAAGYVIGFIPAAGLAGRLGRRAGLPRRFSAGLAAHAAVLAFGVPVLALWLGWSDAVARGLYPFLPGAVAKSALAAVIVAGLGSAITSAVRLAASPGLRLPTRPPTRQGPDADPADHGSAPGPEVGKFRQKMPLD